MKSNAITGAFEVTKDVFLRNEEELIDRIFERYDCAVRSVKTLQRKKKQNLRHIVLDFKSQTPGRKEPAQPKQY